MPSHTPFRSGLRRLWAVWTAGQAFLPREEAEALRKIAIATRRHAAVWSLLSVLLATLTAWRAPAFPAWSWLGGFLACALAAVIVQTPFREGHGGRRWQAWLVGAVATVWLTVYGSITLGWAPSGVSGEVTAVMVLSSGVIGSYVTYRWRPSLVLATWVPLGLYLVGEPLTQAFIHRDAPSAAIAAAAGLFVATLAPLWATAVDSERAEWEHREALDARRREAEAATAAKSSFIALVAHELRTPITAILAGSGELERAPLTPAQQSTARLVGQAGLMMRTLLNDLLDMSKLEAGRMSVERLEMDYRGLLVEQVRLWRPEARKRGLRFQIRGARHAGAAIVCDPTRLRQILNNLISNAFKFTDAGAVTLSILPLVTGEGLARMGFEVSDTGRGMARETLDTLFTPFQQADSSVARTHGGTGLGLSISRELARLLGGDIVVESRPGVGSRFWVTFEADPVAQPAPPAAPRTTLRPVRVLVVDDHELNRRALEILLEPLGVEVAVAAGGAEALDRLADQSFDVVLMDLHMPGLDGRQTTTRLRGRPGPNQAVPVIAVTGATSSHELASCLAAGMTATVAKPVILPQLLQALEAVLDADERAQERALAAGAPA